MNGLKNELLLTIALETKFVNQKCNNGNNDDDDDDDDDDDVIIIIVSNFTNFTKIFKSQED